MTTFVRALTEDIETAAARIVLAVTLLAFHAWETAHAVIVTLVLRCRSRCGVP